MLPGNKSRLSILIPADSHSYIQQGKASQSSIHDMHYIPIFAGVVNNAVYSSYVQHARHEAFDALGFHMDTFTQAGGALALASLSLTFLAPLRSRDKFDVEVWVKTVTAARLVLGQRISLTAQPFKEGDNGSSENGTSARPVLEAEAVVVWLDATYRPVRIPADVKQVFAELGGRQTAALNHKTL